MTSQQRYPPSDQVKEPHSVSLKVLRLSRPSLVAQLPLSPPPSATPTLTPSAPIPASLAYPPSSPAHPSTNPHPFLLTPILQLPPSFGSAYIGETFSCTLCANHEPPLDPPPPPTSDYAATTLAPQPPPQQQQQPPPPTEGSGRRPRRAIRDVRIDAEMKTPASATPTKLTLRPPLPFDDEDAGVDLDPGQTLQRIVDFDLKDEGNHVLGVTVSYYEATATSGRSRSFRKLYQFVCKPSLIVRTKAGLLGAAPQQQEAATPPASEGEDGEEIVDASQERERRKGKKRRWVLEAQLENISEDTMQLEKVELTLEAGLSYRDCNWEASGGAKPVLHPQEVEQVCFVVEEKEDEQAKEEEDGRVVFGVLGVGWRGEMGSRGFLATGKLGGRA
ncbi:unnamed protein product [Discula destructiva]